MSVDWLRLPIYKRGVLVAGPLDVVALNDGVASVLLRRMNFVFDEIENGRCEGRLLPIDIFDALDDLDSDRGAWISDVVAIAGRMSNYYQFDSLDRIELSNWWMSDPQS